MQRIACDRRTYAVIITLNCNMGPWPQNANTQRNKKKQASIHKSRTPRSHAWELVEGSVCRNCLEIIIPKHHETPKRQKTQSTRIPKRLQDHRKRAKHSNSHDHTQSTKDYVQSSTPICTTMHKLRMIRPPQVRPITTRMQHENT